MTITKTYVGQNPDGTPHYSYVSDGHLVWTGPAYGPVTTSDGTTYDVSEAAIEVASLEHAGEVGHLIGVKHEELGHPDHTDPDVPFVHLCGDSCGALAREGVTGVDEVTGHPVRLRGGSNPQTHTVEG
jgi:hypothetical protein